MKGSVLRQMREERGLKAAWVAERAGYSQPHFSKIEAKESIRVDEFVSIMQAMDLQPGDFLPNSGGVSAELKPIVDDLARLRPAALGRARDLLRIADAIAGDAIQSAPASGDNVLQFIPSKSRIPTSSEQIDSLDKAMRALGAEPRKARKGEDRKVPLIANLSAGAGLETFTREHEFRDINNYYWNRGVRAVFRVVGNSMFDMGITDRDLVYVRPIEHAAPKNGDVVACTLNDASYVKVYEKDDAGRVWLKSRAQGYEPIEVKDGDTLRIWGVVLGRTGDL